MAVKTHFPSKKYLQSWFIFMLWSFSLCIFNAWRLFKFFPQKMQLISSWLLQWCLATSNWLLYPLEHFPHLTSMLFLVCSLCLVPWLIWLKRHSSPSNFFLDFFGFFKVTKVTTKSYQGYYRAPKIVKNWPKQHNKLFFCPKGKKSLGRRPKPSAGARSRPT